MRLYIIEWNKVAGYMFRLTWILILLISIGLIRKNTIAVFSFPIRSTVVVIDAGHGGIDPGASGNRGVKEDEVNLEIALKLRRLIEQGGGTAIMIREDDSGLYTEGENAKGTKKSEDLKNRHILVNSCGADIFISIHANSFPQSKYYGAQTFYMRDDDISRRLAESIQNEAIRVLNRGNERKAKATDSIYILKNNNMPGALVECGFLSNHEEERLLEEEHYQEKVAWSIFAGIVKYLEAERAIEQANPPQ
ncbi:MAG TPA: N-acetylmuramoyl-L-alanine amidase CwlD [Bacillota bacterium]|nr:N-acetylmuramoyl-L-alanine amidase CwlD [Bacillota bacterium]HOR86396.1 N-acetylmuramoyl-L-alanine amidase CwlD [Bacillota bacterium]